MVDIEALEAAGIRVGLGADGAACNNRLDPWMEMRLAAFNQSALRGPDTVDPAAILRLATLGGAEALGLADETGSLARGKSADLVVLDPTGDPGAAPGPLPEEDPAAWMVYAGSAALVRETWVRGRPVFRRDEESKWYADQGARIAEARAGLLDRAGLSAKRRPPAGTVPKAATSPRSR